MRTKYQKSLLPRIFLFDLQLLQHNLCLCGMLCRLAITNFISLNASTTHISVIIPLFPREAYNFRILLSCATLVKTTPHFVHFPIVMQLTILQNSFGFKRLASSVVTCQPVNISSTIILKSCSSANLPNLMRK